MGKAREPQVILKSDQRGILLEMGREGKLTAKSSVWDESKPFPRCERPKALGCDRQSRRRRLAPVYDWFTEQFDTRDLKEAKALLDELAA